MENQDHEGRPKAVILLSGGLDSATALAIASYGFDLYALTFLYGQRHAVELYAARRVAKAAGVKDHKVVTLDCGVFGGSALTNDIPVPKDRPIEEMAEGVPVTYVPARNVIFLAYALAWAETLKSNAIFIGVNAIDYSGYPDCRPEFIAAFSAMARLATARAVAGGSRIDFHAPLIEMTKAEIIAQGIRLRVDYSLTVSCYDPTTEGLSCGRCDSCQLRLKGFDEVGITDPIGYVLGACVPS